MSVTCVIAAYNEERTVGAVVRSVRQVPEVSEIIVVSDGSTDGTAEAAAAAGADLIIQLPKNLGKGGAIMAGARRAACETLLLLDADLENLNPAEVSALVGPVMRRECDMAVGVLAADLVQTVLPSLSGLRALPRDALLARPDLAGTRFGIEMALTDLARRLRWSVARVPFTGVVHRRKEEKYGLIDGYRGKVCMALELLGLRGRRRGPLAAPGRMVGATLLVVMVAYASMGIFLSPRAIGSAMDVMPDLRAADRLLVIAAHEDDELLAAGGLIQRALAADAGVWVVFGTNGDANRLAASLSGRRLRPRPSDFIAEGEARQREAQQAMAVVGVPAERVVFLGYPDRGLMDIVVRHPNGGRPYVSPFTKTAASPYRRTFRPGARYTAADLAADLEALIRKTRPTIILTHHPADRHRDHQALTLLVGQVLRRLEGTEAFLRPQVYGYLVHAWDYPRPLRYAPDLALLPPKSLQSKYRWVRFDLTADELAVKQAAMRAYRSQLDSPYLRLLLHSFLRQNELFALIDP